MRLTSWMVLRMHWVGVWLAPFSLAVLWMRRRKAGLLLWLFGAWAFLVPGIVDFGPIHEFEWYRWEFAAGYGLAAALGVALGDLLEERRRWGPIAMALILLLFCQAGLLFLYRFAGQAGNPRPAEVLGVSFDSQEWLLRHGEWLRTRGADLRTLAWVRSNPEVGRGGFLHTTQFPEAWGILFESTAMALADLQALGHRLPAPEEPIGVPPFRISEDFVDFLDQPSGAKARQLGIDWLVLRSDDPQLDRRIAGALTLVSYDNLSPDGKARLLFQSWDSPLRPPEDVMKAAAWSQLEWTSLPSETWEIRVLFVDPARFLLAQPARLPAVKSVALAVPRGCTQVEFALLDRDGRVLKTCTVPPARRMVDPPECPPGELRGVRPAPLDEREVP